jgi:hypothetical protein
MWASPFPLPLDEALDASATALEEHLDSEAMLG